MILPKIDGIYKINYNLSNLTWFKVGGPGTLFKPNDTQDLVNFLKQTQGDIPLHVIGAGSNLIIRDGGCDGIVIKLGKNFTDIDLTTYNDNNILAVSAGCLNINLAKFCAQHDISGFEFLIGIPGTVGGGIAMNAGAYNCTYKDIILAIEALDLKGNLYKFNVDEIGFKYRSNNLPDNLIFTKAYFKCIKGDKAQINNLMQNYLKHRKNSQPTCSKTGGSTFKNPSPELKAWKLIDEVNMRGYKLGDASISELHCNFMINHGSARASDLEKLGNYVKKMVVKKTSIELKWEIKIIGKHSNE
ncbi:MAG: UDP-N-acetylmuramate dehydrogenase [Rickettsiaceae bacterium]